MKPRSGRLVAPMFVLGLLAGGALGSWGQRALFHKHMRSGDQDVPRALARLDAELGLSPEQKAVVEKILSGKQTELAALEKERRDRSDAERLAVRREIAQQLSPDQQSKFKVLCDTADKRIQERWPQPR